MSQFVIRFTWDNLVLITFLFHLEMYKRSAGRTLLTSATHGSPLGYFADSSRDDSNMLLLACWLINAKFVVEFTEAIYHCETWGESRIHEFWARLPLFRVLHWLASVSKCCDDASFRDKEDFSHTDLAKPWILNLVHIRSYSEAPI